MSLRGKLKDGEFSFTWMGIAFAFFVIESGELMTYNFLCNLVIFLMNTIYAVEKPWIAINFVYI